MFQLNEKRYKNLDDIKIWKFMKKCFLILKIIYFVTDISHICIICMLQIYLKKLNIMSTLKFIFLLYIFSKEESINVQYVGTDCILICCVF